MSLRSDADVRAAYDAYAGQLYGVALRGLADRGTAEEAVQETFVRAWRASARFDPNRASLRTWLFVILRSVIADLRRQQAARAPLTYGCDECAEMTNPDDADAALLGWQVEEALRRLSPEHREVLVETRLRGRPHADLAAELHVPVGTIKSRIHYALRALRLALEEQGVEL